MESWVIASPNGKKAKAVHAPTGIEGAAIAAALELPTPRAVLMLSGGAADISPTEVCRLRDLLVEGVARIAAEEGIAVMDGGTQAGVMQMIGEGHAAARGTAPLIGVCPAALVTWPGGPTGEGRVPLEPNHTHFVLTDGDYWGAETDTMFALAAALSNGIPSIALLANGGSVARQEMLHNVRQGREIIVIRGSGRLADIIAAVVAGDMEPPDGEIAAIVRCGRITLFDITDGPEALAALIRQRLLKGGEGDPVQQI
jgi:hypothetical protein